MATPIIDLFAGPGGLSEGFSSVNIKGEPFFDVRLSIEKDPIAHKTLELRSLFHQLKKYRKEVPDQYYEVLREPNLEVRELKRTKLLNELPEGKIARNEAVCLELGKETRTLTDELIKKALGKAYRKKWVLIGGPPCQAYSLAGRSRMGGMSGEDHRVYLYQEYLRIIGEHQPAVFVMENVKGLLSASLDDEKIFHKILKDLASPSTAAKNSCPNYRIFSLVESDVSKDNDYLIKAELYNIPQTRHRVILVGIRNDITIKPRILIPGAPMTLESVIGKLPPLRSALNRTSIKSQDEDIKRFYEKIKDTGVLWKELITGFKKEIISWEGFSKKDFATNLKVPACGRGSEFVEAEETISVNHLLYPWYTDPKLQGLPNHESRSHLLQDLKRYYFASIYATKYGSFPKLEDIEHHSADLLPDHVNARSGKFNDRFRVQLPGKPATTITSHISKDGHYFIHYDPVQCRSLTVREAARIQTFPDNYLFCGSRTQQYQQVGNAVPPYLAKQIAEIVKEVVERI